MGFQNLSLSLKTAREATWDEEGRTRIAEARGRLPKPIDGWAQAAERKGEQVILTVRNADGTRVPQREGICFYSELNHFTTLKNQETKVEGSEITVTLPVADYAPRKLKKLVGLLFHPDGWAGSDGRKYMPVSLSLE